MTDKISMRIRIKNKICSKVKNNPHNSKLNTYFRKFRNKLQAKIRQRKNSYYENIFNKCNGDSILLWREINSVIGQGSKKTPICNLNINGNVISDTKEICNEFNSFFS